MDNETIIVFRDEDTLSPEELAELADAEEQETEDADELV